MLRVPARVRLVLDRRLVEVVAADGARVGADGPGPHSDGVPLLDLEALGAGRQRRGGGGGGGLGLALGVGGGGAGGALDVHGVGHGGGSYGFLGEGEREQGGEEEEEEMGGGEFLVFFPSPTESKVRRLFFGCSFLLRFFPSF